LEEKAIHKKRFIQEYNVSYNTHHPKKKSKDLEAALRLADVWYFGSNQGVINVIPIFPF
jgi:hypothetical protein